MTQQAQTLDQGKLHVESTYRIRHTLTKNGGQVWDLSGAEVTIIFESPDRETQFERDMVLEDAATGIVYYDTTVDDILEDGGWTYNIRVVIGALDVRSTVEMGFQAVDYP